MRYYLRCSLIPTPKGHKSYTKSLQHDQCNSPNVCNSQNKQTHATIKQTTQLKLLKNTAMYKAGKYLCKCLWPLTDHSQITQENSRENTRIDIRENASDNNRENTRGNTWGHIRLRWLGRFWGLADSIESILWMWRAGGKVLSQGEVVAAPNMAANPTGRPPPLWFRMLTQLFLPFITPMCSPDKDIVKQQHCKKSNDLASRSRTLWVKQELCE